MTYPEQTIWNRHTDPQTRRLLLSLGQRGTAVSLPLRIDFIGRLERFQQDWQALNSTIVRHRAGARLPELPASPPNSDPHESQIDNPGTPIAAMADARWPGCTGDRSRSALCQAIFTDTTGTVIPELCRLARMDSECLRDVYEPFQPCISDVK